MNGQIDPGTITANRNPEKNARKEQEEKEETDRQAEFYSYLSDQNKMSVQYISLWAFLAPSFISDFVNII